MSEQAGSRTEQATAKRVEEARKQGKIAMSRDLTAAVSLLAALGVLYTAVGPMMTKLTAVVRTWLGLAGDPKAIALFTPGSLHTIVMTASGECLLIVLPLMGGVAAAATGATFVQSGFRWRTTALQLNFSRLNLLEGLRRLASIHSAVELVKASLKVAFIAAAAVTAVRQELDQLPAWVDLDVPGFLAATGWVAMKVALWIAGSLAVIAAADYGYQKFEWQRSLKMTKQEVKAEHRDTEGDPLIRSRIRSVQKEMARKRMMADVPKADVVITNPTHLAVALRYLPGSMGAPVVVAKGAGYVAERIKQIAREHGVMVVEQKLLARSLYKLVEIGREVPAELYRAVAEILALVYRSKGIAPGGHRMPAGAQERA